MSTIDRETFSGLIREYSPNMYRLAVAILQNSHDAEDAVSEAVLKAFINLDKLRKAEKFKAWIMQITANEARKIYGKQKNTFTTEYMEELMPAFLDEHHELWDAVMKLDSTFREVIVLFYYEQLAIKEISIVLQVKEGTVKSRLFRAKQQLKEMLV